LSSFSFAAITLLQSAKILSSAKAFVAMRGHPYIYLFASISAEPGTQESGVRLGY
jgi:hypothetical protein